ncbi:hypothetical protein XENOCAPTIV_007755 [Xenoophorus captivus]|uniref:Rad51-like C-terminal domain-containing protein n=1 Tax=Xenoophorus captivus TaxID=1517983 RepID=A0ABV0RQU5_9TELE
MRTHNRFGRRTCQEVPAAPPDSSLRTQTLTVPPPERKYGRKPQLPSQIFNPDPVMCVRLQDSLQVCLLRRAPLLLARGLVRLIVIDSVAALFRCEFQPDDWLERNKQLLTFSSMLHNLSQEFTTPILCINQGKVFLGDQSSALRRLEVVFAPHLARNSQDIGVWREGLRAVLDRD